MPFGPWKNWAECISDMTSQGKSEDSARRICGSLQTKLETSNEPFVKLTFEDMQDLCPNCAEHMKEAGLKEVSFHAEFFAKKFQMERPPKEWFDRCVKAVEESGGAREPAAVCAAMWYYKMGETDKDVKEYVRKFAETQTLEDEEVFAVGTWNGDKYTHKDLVKIAENFEKLQSEVKPPVKLGHSEDQKLLKEEGLPAGGWVKKLKVVGDKLIAEISDVPKKIYELIKNGAYRRKSAEIYPTFRAADGKTYGPVLRAVAFLGADIPSVTSLGDLLDNYEAKQPFRNYIIEDKGGDRVKTLGISVSTEKEFGEDFQKKLQDSLKAAFGEDITVKFEDNDAETVEALKKKIEELEKELADYREDDHMEMKQKFEATTKELEDAKKRLADKEKETTELTEAKTKLSEAEKKLADIEVTSHKAEVKSFIEKAKAEGKILPRHEALLTVLMEQLDRKSVLKFTEKVKDAYGNEKTQEVTKTPLEIVKRFVEDLPKAIEYKELSGDTKEIDTFTADGGKKMKVGEEIHDVDDIELAKEAKTYSEKHNVPFDTALLEVSKAKNRQQ